MFYTLGKSCAGFFTTIFIHLWTYQSVNTCKHFERHLAHSKNSLNSSYFISKEIQPQNLNSNEKLLHVSTCRHGHVSTCPSYVGVGVGSHFHWENATSHRDREKIKLQKWELLKSHWPKQVKCLCLTSMAKRYSFFRYAQKWRKMGYWWTAVRFMAAIIYMSIFYYHYFYYYFYQCISSRITLHIFKITQQKTLFLLEHWFIKNICWKILFSVIIQNFSHTTQLLQHFAYTYLTHLVLIPLFCALTFDL